MAQRASTLPIHDAAVAARLLTTLPPFLRERMGGVRARRILADRLEHRQRDFLWLTRHEIYGRPNGIYRRLLDYAGCEFGDLERVVRTEGVEEALRALYRSGVYLTVDELKGRRAVVRGSVRLRVGPGELLHQGVGTSVPSSSGGSRGPGMVIPFRLEHIRDRSVDLRLFFEAR